MDENNKNKNDKVSRIEDFTTSKKDNNDKDDVSLFRRNKDFRNRKRKRFGDRVKDDEYSNEEIHEDDTREMERTQQDEKTQYKKEHDNESLDNGDEVIQHHNNADTKPNEDYKKESNEDIEDKEESYSDSKSDSSEVNQDEKDKIEKDAQEEKSGRKGFINKIPFSKNNSKHNKEKDKNEHQKPLTLEKKRALRRKRQKRIQYVIITVLILLIVIFLLYMFTPLSKISNVNIKGNNNVSKSKINKELNVTSHSRMYTFSKRKAINNLKKNPLIKDVEIHKQLPNTLNVKVTEYQVVGLEKNKDSYVPIIEDGKELKDYSDDVSHDGPIIDGFKGNKKTRIIQALSEMSPEVRSLIGEVSYAPEKNKQNRIEIFTKDDMQVVGDITTIADKMKYYPQMSQSLSRDDSGNLKTDGYIDLSVGASFIPYSGATGAESESDQNVTKSTQQESEAKEELQSVLNKINNQSKDNN